VSVFTDVDVVVSFNGEAVDGSQLGGIGLSVGLLAGEAVDFRVGPRGRINGDSTFLELTVVPEPERSTVVLLGPAWAAVAAARRKPMRAR
jgi:hypothetical protein